MLFIHSVNDKGNEIVITDCETSVLMQTDPLVDALVAIFIAN